MTIRELREKNNIMQKELVIEFGTSIGCFSNYEKGIRSPKIDQLPIMAKLLNCSIEELVFAIIETQRQSKPSV